MDLHESPSDSEDAVGLLRDCHDRLVRALDEIEHLSVPEQGEALDDTERATLGRILGDFATAVPCHAADETESLFPRVRAALVNPDRSALLNLRTVEWEHIVAEAAHWLLEDLGEELVRQGRFETSAKRARFARLVAVLGQLYQEHRRLVEEEVLPLVVEFLTAGDLAAAGREMADRRRAERKEPRRQPDG